MKRENELKLGDAIRLMLQEFGMKEKFKTAGIDEIWAEVMGPSIAEYTEKVYVHKKILWVKMKSAALQQELSYGRSKILENLNAELGEDFLEDIRFN